MFTVLFDNDGVLVDTERLYFQATRETLASAGVEITLADYIEHSMRQGRNTMELAAPAGILGEAVEKLRAKRNARYTELIENTRCLLDGVENVLQQLHGKVRMGIVTGSRRDHFEIIHSATGLLKFFEFHITREDYANSKPHPDAYLTALKRKELDPQRCIVIEDSPRGCAAAHAAGLRCLVIPTQMTTGCEFPGAHKMLKSIGDIVPEILNAAR
jgi:HAD superfamily hydrolase (TIGR01509 family)